MLTIRLPADIENRLNALSKSTGRTKTFYAREAILAHMDEL
ncbi:type II toxin-antitoxin system RelB family antitoxin, partial [Chitinimonas sp. BJB300]